MTFNILAYLFWNPQREVFNFNLPFLNRPILWYGVFFATGLALAYLIAYLLLKPHLKEKASLVIDKISLYTCLGLIIGAKGADVIFYQGVDILKDDYFVFLRFWEPGLASHGGLCGALSGIYLFYKFNPLIRKDISLLSLLDALVIPGLVLGCFIRCGNFFNQEVIGKPSTLPWAVIFGDPVDRNAIVPRHPTQIYEAIGCLLMALVFAYLWKKPFFKNYDGKIFSTFLVLFFSFRFFVESFKLEQSSYLMNDQSHLMMGQYLSLPFILLGIYICIFKSNKKSL